MRTIWKFEIPITDTFTLRTPKDIFAIHFIGTFQQRDGAPIWHLFELGYKTAA